jgi:hypothetical protein
LAAVATTVVSVIDAPRKPFYAWLIPGVFYSQLETVLRDAAFMPGVTKTTDTTGPWDKVGSTRIVHLTDGTTVRETVTSATAPDYFAYRLTEFSSPAISRLVKEASGGLPTAARVCRRSGPIPLKASTPSVQSS